MASKNRLSPIPHPPTKPVVGNMLSIDATAPVQHLVRMTKELGPIFWLDMMGVPMVIVSGAALVDELSDEKRFDKAVRGALRRIEPAGLDIGGPHARRHIDCQDDCFFEPGQPNDGGGPGGSDDQRCDADKQDRGRNMAPVVPRSQCFPDQCQIRHPERRDLAATKQKGIAGHQSRQCKQEP